MTMDELQALLKECSDHKLKTVLPQHRLKEDLMMTSFSMMMLLLKAEEKTGRSYDARLLSRAKTVQDLYNIIAETSNL